MQGPIQHTPQESYEASEAARVMQSFEHQWAALLTTYRHNGTGVGTPINLAVEGDRAYFRTSARSYKVKRIRGNPIGQVAACSPNGRVTGAAVPCDVRMLHGAEAAHAEHTIKRKYPIVQGVLVSLLQTATRDPGACFEVTPRRS